jgi:hypothetical protein
MNKLIYYDLNLGRCTFRLFNVAAFTSHNWLNRTAKGEAGISTLRSFPGPNIMAQT